jgi:O-antigen/teichoic acid export membrane protein
VTEQAENTKRIAKNTLMLYVRMLFGMLVSLYTSRVVLQALGVEDYGIYNVVGGVVAMFSLLSGSLSAAVSRFLTYELGRNDLVRLSKVFSSALCVHSLLALVVLVLSETIGLWFLNYQMNIPPDRMIAANWVFQFSLFSFLLGLFSVPYNASIISHERMSIFAFVGIGDILLQLGIVLFIAYGEIYSDKLIVYASLLVVKGLLFQLFYFYYCRKSFKECRFRLSLNKQLLKEMTGFAGWNFIGASSAILRDQGGNILLNLFYGPALNAARGVANQVSNAIGAFVGNFMIALNPQITKSYAAAEYGYMFSLIFKGARFSYYLLLWLALPVLLNTQYILSIWLNVVPEHATLFVQLVLVFSMCEAISNPLITVMLATGKIRNYQIVVGGLQMMNFPLSYIFLKMGFLPEIIVMVAISLSLICLGARLILLRDMIQLPVARFLRHVCGNIIVVTILSLTVPMYARWELPDNLFGFIFSCIICFGWGGMILYRFGCSVSERKFLINKLQAISAKRWNK